MSKVLLINPPQTYFAESQDFAVYFPLGLLYAAAMIRGFCEIEILDCLVRDFTIERLDDRTVYGTPFERIGEQLRHSNPDIVGITVPFTAQFENAAAVADLCRETNPETTIIMGGPDPSVRYREILEGGHADYCVVGEGEETFRDLVGAINRGADPAGIPGLAYLRDGTVRYEPRPFIKDLDRLPFPAYDLIDVSEYLENRCLYTNRSSIHEHSISMITSRGCPYGCVFCSVRLHMGRRYRCHSVDYVLRHLRLCVDQLGIRSFHFEDDNISLDRDRFEAILDGIIEQDLNIRWDTPNGIRADTLNPHLLQKMKRSGCADLTLAIESGNQRVLDEVIRKATSLECMISVAEMCREARLQARSFYVIGFPGETVPEMRQTTALALRLFRRSDLWPVLLIATPLYGTELYDICLARGYIEENLTPEQLAKCTQTFGEPLIETEEFTRNDVHKVASDFDRQFSRQRIRFHVKHPLRSARKLTSRIAAAAAEPHIYSTKARRVVQ